MATAIDLFSGWGGFTLGAKMAGVKVRWAANHWPLAVQTHALNHPETRHECQDLRQADWTKLPAFDLMLASPACQGHSQASQPKRQLYHDALRATAWAVVDCADVTGPKAIIVENVPDFRAWRLFPQWRSALEALGYHLQEHVVTASTVCDVPQRRTRLFIVATRKRVGRIVLEERREPAFAPCVEWHVGTWRPIKEASQLAQERIRRGRARFGRRFFSQHVTGHPGVGLDEPIRTITTKDQWIVVDGDTYRPLTLREYARGMGFPDSFTWPKASRVDVVKGLGNAVPPPLACSMINEVVGLI